MMRVSEIDGRTHFSWNPTPAARAFAVGDTVHVRGVVENVGLSSVCVLFNSLFDGKLLMPQTEIVAHEPAQLKVGDKVQSKDSRVGTIRYIEDDWALVVETHKCKAIRYLIDLQRAP